MDNPLRDRADGYLKAARGGGNRPDKFAAESLFHLTALAIEGYLIAWLEDRGLAPSHHGFRNLVAAWEKSTPFPEPLRERVLVLDQYQKLCEWIPIEPRKPTRDDLPGLLDLAGQVGDLTR